MRLALPASSMGLPAAEGDAAGVPLAGLQDLVAASRSRGRSDKGRFLVFFIATALVFIAFSAATLKLATILEIGSTAASCEPNPHGPGRRMNRLPIDHTRAGAENRVLGSRADLYRRRSVRRYPRAKYRPGDHLDSADQPQFRGI